jgi:hypothetical protein
MVPSRWHITAEQLQELAKANPDLRLERTAAGELRVMPHSGTAGALDGRRQDTSLFQHALRDLVEGTAVHTGEAFFNALVQHLARAVGTKYAWVTEWLEDTRRLRALSFWVGDSHYQGNYEYDIANTPCETVIERQQLIHVPERVLELYPGDPDLPPLGAVSYMRVALLDTDARLLGHLAVLHDAPMPEDARVTAIFHIFASRAAAVTRCGVCSRTSSRSRRARPRS